jgi:hypothetical protein
MRKPTRRRNGGAKIIVGLRELSDAIIDGDTSKLIMHTVTISDAARSKYRRPRSKKNRRQDHPRS